MSEISSSTLSEGSKLHKIASEKGLPEFSSKQLVELIKIELLYTSYKDLEDIVVLKPKKPKEIKYPVEPTEPVEPLMPVYQNIEGSSPQMEEIRISLFKQYEQEKKDYPENLKKYKEEIEKYKIDKANYLLEVSNFDKNSEKYDKEMKSYSKELDKYERFEFQKELNEKIKRTYTKWTKKPWNKNHKQKLTYFMLMGPPGHGKTTVMKQAAKMVAHELDLVYRENPTIDVKIDKNSFVLYVNNLAGEVSKTGTAGLPTKTIDEEGNEYTGLLPSYSMSSLTRAGAGMLLLDDLANASSFIQNIALPLTNDNSFNELKLDNVYIGITSNLGALDGTNISKISSALLNRVKVAFLTDNVNDFIYRVRHNEEYFDDIGDFFVTDFIEKNKEDPNNLEKIFYSLPDVNKLGGYSNPRSLEATINELRRNVYDMNGFNEENKKILSSIVKSILGNEVGGEFFDYVDSVYSEAIPLIDDYFHTGKFDKVKFEEKTKNNFSVEDRLFEYRFRKYLEKKIRNEAFKIERMQDEKDKNLGLDVLFNKISIIYPMLTDNIKSAFSASLRTDVFLGMPSFSMPHVISSNKEVFETQKSIELIRKIVENYKEKGLTLSEVDKKYIKSISVTEIEDVFKKEMSKPKRTRKPKL